MADPLALTSDERSWAMAAHAVSFVDGGILAPLLIYLLKKDTSEFVAFHALQSIYFGLLAAVIIVPCTLVTCGLGAVLIIPYLVIELIATVRANEGEWYFLPIVGTWAWSKHHPPQG